MRGTYTLALRVDKPATIRIGSFGTIRFRGGTYLYIGSGLGKNASSIEGRARRHLGMRHRTHWHIDYLLDYKRVTLLGITYAVTQRHVECRLSQCLSYGLPAAHLYPRFGSSDCNCQGHLLFLGKMSRSQVIALVRKAYRNIGLNFRQMI